MLKESGGAGEVFASYSEGVVDSIGSTISAVKHPVQTAKNIGAGFKAIAEDPVGVASQLAKSVKSTISDVSKGDFNSLAYMAGGLSVDIAGGAVSKLAATKLSSAFSSAKCTILNNGCFVAGTLVLTIDGHKPIETIEAGDFVLSSDPETGEVTYKEVLQTYVFIKDALVYVTINGEVIETTKEHPFWIEGQGWTKAEFLKAGDVVRSDDGSGIEIEDVEIFELPEDEYVVVYNLEVADFHSYYVSEFDVLVHNTCPVRNKTGKAFGGETLENPSKAMKNHGAYGVIPKDVADQLRGRTYNNFNEFRMDFWKEYGNSKYSSEFSAANIKRMKKGLAPYAAKSQHYGKHAKYILHHITPIQHGGGVYDLDNLMIVTPKKHQSILPKSYHFGKG